MSKNVGLSSGVAPVLPTYDDPVDIPSTFFNYANSNRGPGVYSNAINRFAGNDSSISVFNSYSTLWWDPALMQALGTKVFYGGGNIACKTYTTGWRDRIEWKNDNLDGSSGSREPGLFNFNAYYRTDPYDYYSSVYTKWSVRGTEWLNNATTGTAYPHQGDNLEKLQLGRLNSKWVRCEIEFFTMPYRPTDSKYDHAETRVYFRATGQTWDGGSNYRHYIIHGTGDNGLDIYNCSIGYEGSGTLPSSGTPKDFTSWTRDWRVIHVQKA